MKKKIAVVGLGYVGLPLATEFSKYYETWGYDTSQNRIAELLQGIDKTKELSQDELIESQVTYTSNLQKIQKADYYIITVPTPIDKSNIPDLTYLESASRGVGEILKKGSIVIYESTVYPGCTEEICVPILEKASGLTYNKDFFCGYSPERINPGDKEHRLPNIKKITSGSTEIIAKEIDDLYSTIIKAGTYRAESIKIAEAAKAVENTQRDMNIALINELSKLCHALNISTMSVINAASTKWNFNKFTPGLVGGHCIGVDPYYLAYKSQEHGIHPEIMLAGRRINNSMPEYIYIKIIKEMAKKSINFNDAKILIMGYTFKENCPDIRNTKIYDLYTHMSESFKNIDIFDPVMDLVEARIKYKNINFLENISGKYDCIVLAVPHNDFELYDGGPLAKHKNNQSVIIDLKSFFKQVKVDWAL